MTVAEEHRLNAGVIRRDFLDGLNAMTDARAEELRQPLTEHVRALVPAVRALLPYMEPRRRQQAEHCLKRAAETLELVAAVTPLTPIGRTHDLAVSARALLVLYRRPGFPETD
ncbi:DUF6415 family natural product biosynthesis protein [Streptomyces sp. NBC_00443]|uniref:DUF6415 family natural product biosynthesis protein n=1 Tax=Streptomyces sp. NBC_00443 TaxID=2975743 RepID=UPI002E1FF4E9